MFMDFPNMCKRPLAWCQVCVTLATEVNVSNLPPIPTWKHTIRWGVEVGVEDEGCTFRCVFSQGIAESCPVTGDQRPSTASSGLVTPETSRGQPEKGWHGQALQQKPGPPEEMVEEALVQIQSTYYIYCIYILYIYIYYIYIIRDLLVITYDYLCIVELYLDDYISSTVYFKY